VAPDISQGSTSISCWRPGQRLGQCHPPGIVGVDGCGGVRGQHLEGPALGPDDTRNLLLPLLTPKQYQELQRNKSIDFCFSRESIGRFRANVHHQRGTLAGSVRLLPPRIPTLESLHLPPTLQRLAEARQGLVLITGSTGCGKSSTRGIDRVINTERRDHIVTIEDPVGICARQPQFHRRAD
jgi:Tfp pilus assembly pilus retraction ATPase PilT